MGKSRICKTKSHRIGLTEELKVMIDRRLDDVSEDIDKIRDILSESFPKDLYVIKEVTFDSDVLNNEQCIFFQNEHNPFSVWRYPAPDDDLPQYIRDAMKFFMREYGLRPRFVLIPFNVMALNQAKEPLYPEDLPMPSFKEVCREFGLAWTILVPERLKDKVVCV